MDWKGFVKGILKKREFREGFVRFPDQNGTIVELPFLVFHNSLRVPWKTIIAGEVQWG
jgi:hypothetical protein